MGEAATRSSHPATPTAPPPHEPRVVLDGVSWDTYERLLADLGDRPGVRLTYDRGVLEIMSPSQRHDRYSRFIHQLLSLVLWELDIPMVAFGSSTHRREDLAKGLEPDECYYIQNADRVRGKMEFDFTVDPPPDLVVEIDITHSSVPRMPIWAALGVPEFWRWDGKTMQFFALEDGEYAPRDASLAMPFLHATDLRTALAALTIEPENAILRTLIDRLRERRGEAT